MADKNKKQKFATEAGLFYRLDKAAFLQRDEFHLWESSADHMEAIKHCNLYFICHRTRIGVNPNSMDVTADTITIYFEFWDGLERYPFPIAFRNKYGTDIYLESESPFNYFKIKNKSGETLYEAKATHFVDDYKHTLVPHPKFMDLKVLYIGQALDKSDKPTFNRLVKHEALEKIYSVTPPDKEVFLFLFPLFNVDNYIEMKNSSPSQEAQVARDNERLEVFIKSKLQLPFDRHINIAEAAFIKYFKPKYNKHHTTTFPTKRNDSYKELYEMDFNTVGIKLDETEMDYHFFSDTVSSSALHNHSFFLPTKKDRRKLFEDFD